MTRTEVNDNNLVILLERGDIRKLFKGKELAMQIPEDATITEVVLQYENRRRRKNDRRRSD